MYGGPGFGYGRLGARDTYGAPRRRHPGQDTSTRSTTKTSVEPGGISEEGDCLP